MKETGGRTNLAYAREEASAAFEQQIRRIYELLEESGAEVTWDDHIPDPDNPSQSRQIDVTIRRSGKLTLVECRKHKSRQDVKWIEELIGRRTSLGAQGVIAVSSSGFTTGALAKSRAHGIIPRDLQQLTDLEIASWGQQVAITLFFYQYSDLEVSLLFERESIPKLDMEVVKSELRGHPCVQSLFNAAAQQLSTLSLVADEQPGRTVGFDLKIQFEGFRLCGESVLEVDFRGRARLLPINVAPPIVLGYGEPNQDSEDREAIVETYPSLGRTSISHNGSRIWAFLDLSQLEVPPFCQFRYFKLSGEQEMDHEAVELYGLEKLRVAGKGINVNLCSV
jgi:hypothetical protein